MALFFLKAHRAAPAEGRAGRRRSTSTDDAAMLDARQGRSSPNAARAAIRASCRTPPPGLDPDGCAGPDYLDCWNRYWAWTKTDEFKSKMREIVLAPDFLDGQLPLDRLRACR